MLRVDTRFSEADAGLIRSDLLGFGAMGPLGLMRPMGVAEHVGRGAAEAGGLMDWGIVGWVGEAPCEGTRPTGEGVGLTGSDGD